MERRTRSAEGNDFLFGSTQDVAQTLVLETVPPAAGLLVAMALGGLGLRRRKRAR